MLSSQHYIANMGGKSITDDAATDVRKKIYIRFTVFQLPHDFAISSACIDLMIRNETFD